MRQFLNFIQQYPFVIYIVIFVGVPMLGRIIKGIKDKRRENERKRMAQRAEMEALRTGRSGGAEYTPQRPNAPQPSFPATQPMAQGQSQLPAAPPPSTAARAGQPRYVQLPGGVILELPPAPTGPTAGMPQAPRPAAPRPAPRPQQRPQPQRPAPRPPVARTPAPRPQRPQTQQQAQQQAQQQTQHQTRQQTPQQAQGPRGQVQTSQQVAARRQAAEDKSRAQLVVRDREEREADERRRLSDDRQRAAREEHQRQQTDKIVAEAYRQSAPVAGDRATPGTAVTVGKMKLKKSDLRRVMILREVLDPPVSMRDGL